jgi:hypothetical protein
MVAVPDAREGTGQAYLREASVGSAGVSPSRNDICPFSEKSIDCPEYPQEHFSRKERHWGRRHSFWIDLN